jgi:hypothetical protein
MQRWTRRLQVSIVQVQIPALAACGRIALPTHLRISDVILSP